MRLPLLYFCAYISDLNFFWHILDLRTRTPSWRMISAAWRSGLKTARSGRSWCNNGSKQWASRGTIWRKQMNSSPLRVIFERYLPHPLPLLGCISPSNSQQIFSISILISVSKSMFEWFCSFPRKRKTWWTRSPACVRRMRQWRNMYGSSTQSWNMQGSLVLDWARRYTILI